MSENEIVIDAMPEAVWAVLADPHTFDAWVLGAQNVRDADDSWPAVGSKLHHSTGVGPLTVDDETQVEESVPPTRLVLVARVRPLGEFRITLALQGANGRTTLSMHEEPVGGVAAHTPGADPALAARNAISLGKLKELAEGAAADRP
jgi:uncharacterized protein YndB with AHSA1/START domain